jgi:enoyl-CoA hydratase/carnithine racemase
MKFKTIKWEIISSPDVPGDNAIGVLTLNVPSHSNALGPRMGMELNHVMDEIRHSQARVVIITGAGGNFCAGGDLKVELTPLELEDETLGLEGEYGDITRWWMNDYFHQIAQKACVKLENLPQPVIAAVDGIAVGVGLELAICCDLRIVSDRVRFAELAVPAGFMSEWSAPRVLPQLVGQSMATEMILMARPVYGEEAVKIGLANKMVPADRLMDEAIAWASRLASYPTLGVRYAKETLRYYQLKNRSEEGLQLELDRVLEITRTRDCAEGITAFLEKRPPVYHPGNPVKRPGKEFK